MKYFTTPIFYVNSKPHIGAAHNMCLVSFFRNAFLYFHESSYILTGTDEHGQKIFNTSQKNHMNVIDFVNHNAKLFKDLADLLNVKYNRFIRTTDEDHKKNVLNVWKHLLDKGFIYKDIYSGWYAERDECFYKITETYIKEEKRYAASTNAIVEFIEEECYFFKLSSFKEKLLKFYEENKNFVIPNNLINELITFTYDLKDLCISRKIDWGIDIPNENTKIYVWLDALFNYITAIGGIDNYNQDLWNNVVHVIGKDIIIFHGVYWPALLMALEIKPPKHLLVHGWWLMNKDKMSKSLGNVVSPEEILFGNSDYMHYYFCREALIGRDGDFDVEIFANIINKEIMDKFCNLFYRVFALLYKKYGQKDVLLIHHLQAEKDISHLKQNLKLHLDNFYVHKFVEELSKFTNKINEFVEKEQIWNHFTDDISMYLIHTITTCIDIYEILIPNTVNEIKKMYIKQNDKLNIYNLKQFFNKIIVQNK